MKAINLLGSLMIVLVVSACSGGGGNSGVNGSGGADTTAPVVSGALPSGSKPAGTTSVTMQVTTDENATCRYSSAATDTYSAMTAFTTTGTTTHSTTITGLQNGVTYNRYIRCSDATGNANTSSTTVTWNIAAGTGTATLGWSAPTTNKDGGALTELTGYKVYNCLSASGPCTNYSLYATTTATTYNATGLSSGYNCFAVKAYNSGGDSASTPCASGSCCKTIP